MRLEQQVLSLSYMQHINQNKYPVVINGVWFEPKVITKTPAAHVTKTNFYNCKEKWWGIVISTYLFQSTERWNHVFLSGDLDVAKKWADEVMKYSFMDQKIVKKVLSGRLGKIV